MSLSDLVFGFKMGLVYSSQENREASSVTVFSGDVIFNGPLDKYFSGRIIEEQAPKHEIAGFYTALVVRNPQEACKAFYEGLRNIRL